MSFMEFEFLNSITLSGLVLNYPTFLHDVYDVNFYKFYLQVSRLSGGQDVLPITIDERTVNYELDKLEGSLITIHGRINVHQFKSEETLKKHLNVYARMLSYKDFPENNNMVRLAGLICTTPVYRLTPLGREICDVRIKVDYIDCIAWDENARNISNKEIGAQISLLGRLQSREYMKEEQIKKTYEVSIMKILKIFPKEFN